MTKKYYRSIQEVVYPKEGDTLFPWSGLNTVDVYQDQIRTAAIMEVLRRIPPRDYQRLTDKQSAFRWFVPHKESLALLYPFGCTHREENTKFGFKRSPRAEVLFLSPLLEENEFGISIAIIAHELAHIFLNHATTVPPKNYNKQEKEAWQVTKMWGFDCEIKKYVLLKKREFRKEMAEDKKLFGADKKQYKDHRNRKKEELFEQLKLMT